MEYSVDDSQPLEFLQTQNRPYVNFSSVVFKNVFWNVCVVSYNKRNIV